MANPFSRFGVSDSEIAKALRESAEVDATLNEKMENEIVPYGRNASRVDEGRYAASWKVIKKAKNGRGVVGPTDFKAHWIEFGTGAPGPTKAYAPVQKTAEHFGGDLTSGVSVGGDE